MKILTVGPETIKLSEENREINGVDMGLDNFKKMTPKYRQQRN